jgi:hypothetical protein
MGAVIAQRKNLPSMTEHILNLPELERKTRRLRRFKRLWQLLFSVNLGCTVWQQRGWEGGMGLYCIKEFRFNGDGIVPFRQRCDSRRCR